MRIFRATLDGCPVTVIEMNAPEVQCVICRAWGFHRHAVAYYEEPCCSIYPERGWKLACKSCHDRWAAWDDLMLQLAAARGVEAILGARLWKLERQISAADRTGETNGKA